MKNLIDKTRYEKPILNRVNWIIYLLFSMLLICSFSHAEEFAGKTILAKGKVEATNQVNQEIRKLRRRSKIFSVDNIITGENSKVQFSMSDGGLISLKENTEIRISEYSFNEESGESGASLEVVSGGLRSISGLIKKSGGDYQVKTPVGSIGIRGTHFAVEVSNGKTFFAVYSGNIDVLLKNQNTLSLGDSENFAFAAVGALGEVKLLTQAPPEISKGYGGSPSAKSASDKSSTHEGSDSESSSEDGTGAESSGEQSADEEKLGTESLTEQNSGSESSEEQSSDTESSTELFLAGYGVSQGSESGENSVYNESLWQGMSGAPLAELIAERTGSLTYQSDTANNITSSGGEISNFTMDMTIDFDHATVPGGSLSFSDDKGEWYATYSGLINVDQLELGINSASHGNNKAEGTIFAGFSDGLDEVAGGFNLHEINDPGSNTSGSFKLRPKK